MPLPAIIGAAAWAVPLIVKYGPELAKYLGGARAGDIAAKGADIIQTVTGTSDPVKAEIVLADPARQVDLQLQLSRIAADTAADERRNELETFRAQLGDVASARSQTVALAQVKSPMAWAPAVISIFVIICFMTCIVLLLFINKSWDTFTTSLLQTLFGALVLAFGQVINYWLGASNSGRRAQDANQALAEKVTEAANRNVETITRATQEGAAKALPVPPVVVVPPTPGPLPAPVPVDSSWKQGPYGGARWKVTRDGVQVEGDPGVARTVGEPVTVRRAWAMYGETVKAIAMREGVPTEIAMMVLCTESGSKLNAAATLVEPDKRVSSGIMQVLTGTASDMLGRSVTVEDLQRPEVSIEAGVKYIKFHKDKTWFDPILSAASYNAGSLGPLRPGKDNNRFNLRSTGDHLERAIRWYGDICYVADQDGWFK